MRMIAHFFKKYWLGLLLTVLFIWIGWQTEGNFNDGMFLATCLGILSYFIILICAAKMGNGRMAITMITAVISIFKLLWYIISLKPLRRWFSRMKVKGGSPTPYPFLALYGSITDSQAMMENYSSAFWHDRTPAVRAAIWRLFSRDVLKFGPNASGQTVIKLGEWKQAPSDGVDQALEQTIYLFLRQSITQEGVVDSKSLYRVISYQANKKKQPQYDLDNQFRFADILSTSISKHDYSENEIRNIYGMKKFLKNLPSSFSQITGPASQIDLKRIWSEYVAYAYLFDIENKTIRNLSGMFPGGSLPPLIYLLTTSELHRNLLSGLMNSASKATLWADDIVSSNRGRLKIAWHAEEAYDIETN